MAAEQTSGGARGAGNAPPSGGAGNGPPPRGPADRGRPRRVRWWPLVVLVVAVALGIGAVQGGDTIDQQETNVRTAAVGVVGLGLAMVWLLFLSRVPTRVRLGILGATAVSVVALGSGFRFRGVTGDLLPILEWEPPWAVGSDEASSGAGVAAPEPFPGELQSGHADLQQLSFPQFFGPARDGVVPGPLLEPDWVAHPPEQLWRVRVGEGWSGFAVAGGRAVTQEQHGQEEAVVCYHLPTGQVVWVHRDRARYAHDVAGTGPRATPTLLGGRVFAVGSTGILNCLDLRTGAVLWSVDILEDNGAALPEWGVACSPLVVGDRVVVIAGGPKGRSLVAYDVSTGAFRWGGGDDRANWSSPVRAELCGVEQILSFHARGVSGHHLEDGRVLWTHAWRPDHPHVCMPVPLAGDRVLVSSGYGTGAHLLRIRNEPPGGWRVERLWRSLHLKAKFANVVTRDGFAYGLDDGRMVCVDLATGKRTWKRGRYGHGQVLLVGGLLLVTTEQGEVLLLDPTPDEHREIARLRVFDRKTWNPPAVAGAHLLVRNDREAACYRLPVRK